MTVQKFAQVIGLVVLNLRGLHAAGLQSPSAIPYNMQHNEQRRESPVRKLLVIAAIASFAAPVSATIVKYDFTGSVATVSSSGSTLDLPTAIADPFALQGMQVSGSVTIDDSAPNVSLQSNTGQYLSALRAFSANVNGLDFSFDSSNPPSFRIVTVDNDDVTLNVGTPINFLEARADFHPNFFTDPAQASYFASIAMDFSTRDLGLINSTQIPDLSAFGGWNVFLSVVDSSTSSDYQIDVSVPNLVAEPVPVPEPGSALLLLTCLPLIALGRLRAR